MLRYAGDGDGTRLGGRSGGKSSRCARRLRGRRREPFTPSALWRTAADAGASLAAAWSHEHLVRARRGGLHKATGRVFVPHSCARARTVASEVFTEAQSFADCKLHIRTRLLASAFSNFWKTPPPSDNLLV